MNAEFAICLSLCIGILIHRLQYKEWGRLGTRPQDKMEESKAPDVPGGWRAKKISDSSNGLEEQKLSSE